MAMSIEEYRALQPQKRVRRKYGNKPQVIGGVKLDSKAEAARYAQLAAEERMGIITGLETHPSWPLVVNGVKIGRYSADFRYTRNGVVIVEDVKSPATARTQMYVMRRKLLLALHNITVTEVMAK